MTSESLKAETAYVCIVDDDSEVCRSIELTLTSMGYSVHTFPAADEFLAQPSPGTPMTVLIDFLLPGMTGLGLCREIVARNLPCTFAVISGNADVSSAVQAMKMGAVDLLEKPFSRQSLLEVVNKAIEAARGMAQRRVEEKESASQLALLSTREREVFDAITAGLVTKEIAGRLGISVRTVDVHRSRIKQKLGIDSPLQLANLLAAVQRHSS